MTVSSKFLSKGGVILGIAAFSKSRDIDCWPRLGPAMRHPVRKFTGNNTSQQVVEMARAVRVAAGGDVPVSVPAWVHTCLANDALLENIGNRVSFQWPLMSETPAPRDRAGGLLALAVALCRNTDLAKTVSRLFTEAATQTQFWDAASVAAVLAQPGVPSRMRREIKECVAVYEQTK